MLSIKIFSEQSMKKLKEGGIKKNNNKLSACHT